MASKAAAFGPAAAAWSDQPPASRMLAKRSSPKKPSSSATSLKSGACCVQAMVTGSFPPRAARTRSISAPQSWSPETTRAVPQARATSPP
jgi:hypothetical protein